MIKNGRNTQMREIIFENGRNTQNGGRRLPISRVITTGEGGYQFLDLGLAHIWTRALGLLHASRSNRVANVSRMWRNIIEGLFFKS